MFFVTETVLREFGCFAASVRKFGQRVEEVNYWSVVLQNCVRYNENGQKAAEKYEKARQAKKACMQIHRLNERNMQIMGWDKEGLPDSV